MSEVPLYPLVTALVLIAVVPIPRERTLLGP